MNHDLDDKLTSVLTSLKDAPVTLMLDSAETPASIEVIVNWHDFLNLLHWMLYNPESLRYAPLLINETEKGDLAVLTQLMNTVFPAPKNDVAAPTGAFFAITCNDQYRDRTQFAPPSGRYDGFAITSFMETVCETPEFSFSGHNMKAPVQSDTPALLLTGYFDPMTPDIYAEQTQRLFPNSHLVSVPNFGHSTLSGFMACQTVLAKSFIDTLEKTDAFACADTLPGPNFVLPAAIAQ